MDIKPILKYPGAKWSIADWIVSHFPPHTHYLEPYCGSAAAFFAKSPAVHEVLNDLNGSIVNLFAVLRQQGEELARLIDFTPWSEAEYARYEKHYDNTGDPLEDARRFLVRSWQAHGGTINQVSGWKHNGLRGNAYPVRLWRKLPERLLAVVDRLKEAEIRNRPALELIDYYNHPDCLIYCLAEGTLIRTVDEQLVPIELIREGDMIAPARTVKRVMTRFHQGQVRRIRIQGLPEPLIVTDEHKVVRIPGKTGNWQDQRTDAGLWRRRESVEANMLKVGDYLLIPLGGVESEIQWDWHDESRQKGVRRKDVHFVPGPELFRFLGYYIAEGYLQRQGGHVTEAILSFNTEEISTHITDVIHCCQVAFGITPHLRPGPSSATVTQVCIRSTTIAEFIERYVYGLATTKSLATELMTAPHAFQRELLIGWLRGDGGMYIGTRNRVKLTGTTRSEVLARQMFQIALRCNLRPSFKRRFTHATYQARGEKGQEKSVTYDVYFASEDAAILGWNVPSKRFCSTRRIIEGHMLVRIREITVCEYAGNVFDLDVDGDDTFAAPYALVHNCDPPYLLSTRARKYYRHEMTDKEHLTLLEALKRHRGPVVLSGYSHPLYEEQLAGWSRTTTLATTEHGNTRIEVLWLNPKATLKQQQTLFDVVSERPIVYREE